MTPKEYIASRMRSTGAFMTGEFRLASGKMSDMYLDCRLLTLDSKSLPFIVHQMIAALDEADIEPTRVGGLSVGADPLVAGFLMTGWRGLKGFFVRKEQKQHGTGRVIEGHLSSHDAVLIVDDVLTSGSSAKKTADAVLATGARIVGVVTIVDREEGGREALAPYNFPILSLITLAEVRQILT